MLSNTRTKSPRKSRAMKRRRTTRQNSIMFGLAAKCGLTHDDLRDYAAEISQGRTDHTSELYATEAEEIISRLKGVAPQLARRTVQHRRQLAGIKQTHTVEQLDLMRDLAADCGLDEAGLKAFCQRQVGRDVPATTEETNKVVEALKGMKARGWKATKKTETEAA